MWLRASTTIFGSRARAQPYANLIPHRARGDEERGLFLEDFGGAFLQAVDARVFEETSSPTSASAMARRIVGVGFVTVSLRRSMMFILILLRFDRYLIAQITASFH